MARDSADGRRDGRVMGADGRRGRVERRTREPRIVAATKRSGSCSSGSSIATVAVGSIVAAVIILLRVVMRSRSSREQEQEQEQQEEDEDEDEEEEDDEEEEEEEQQQQQQW